MFNNTSVFFLKRNEIFRERSMVLGIRNELSPKATVFSYYEAPCVYDTLFIYRPICRNSVDLIKSIKSILFTVPEKILLLPCRSLHGNTDSCVVDCYLCHMGIKTIGQTMGSYWISRDPDEKVVMGIWARSHRGTSLVMKSLGIFPMGERQKI